MDLLYSLLCSKSTTNSISGLYCSRSDRLAAASLSSSLSLSLSLCLSVCLCLCLNPTLSGYLLRNSFIGCHLRRQIRRYAEWQMTRLIGSSSDESKDERKSCDVDQCILRVYTIILYNMVHSVNCPLRNDLTVFYA